MLTLDEVQRIIELAEKIKKISSIDAERLLFLLEKNDNNIETRIFDTLKRIKKKNYSSEINKLINIILNEQRLYYINKNKPSRSMHR